MKTLHLLDSVTGEATPLLSIAPATFGLVRVSSDDRWIYFNESVHDADIWLRSVDEGTR